MTWVHGGSWDVVSAAPGLCAIPGYLGIYGVGISRDCVGHNCVNTSVGPSVHHPSLPSTTRGVRERSNPSPGSRSTPGDFERGRCTTTGSR
eukprot:4423320-Prymnesium_polylepis.1